jgi:hypothetical protein
MAVGLAQFGAPVGSLIPKSELYCLLYCALTPNPTIFNGSIWQLSF